MTAIYFAAQQKAIDPRRPQAPAKIEKCVVAPVHVRDLFITGHNRVIPAIGCFSWPTRLPTCISTAVGITQIQQKGGAAFSSPRSPRPPDPRPRPLTDAVLALIARGQFVDEFDTQLDVRRRYKLPPRRLTLPTRT